MSTEEKASGQSEAPATDTTANSNRASGRPKRVRKPNLKGATKAAAKLEAKTERQAEKEAAAEREARRKHFASASARTAVVKPLSLSMVSDLRGDLPRVDLPRVSKPLEPPVAKASAAAVAHAAPTVTSKKKKDRFSLKVDDDLYSAYR